MKGIERFAHLCLLTAVFALLIGGGIEIASADRVDDVKAQGKEMLCKTTAYFQMRGALARFHSIPLVFKYASPNQIGVLAELAEHGQAPVDAMYFKDDGLTDHEKEFWETNAKAGWAGMDAKLKKQADTAVSEPDWDEYANQLLVDCFNTNESRLEQRGRFVRVASSEGLAAPRVIGSNDYKRELCLVKGMEGDEILKRRASGQPKITLQAEVRATDMTDDQRAEMNAMLERAYAWAGTRREFVNFIYAACMR